jgi:hypothetical protein
MDSGIIEKNLEDEARAFGLKNPGDATEGGAYCFKMTGEDGSDIKSLTPLEFGGRLFYPNEKGVFRIVDQGFLDRAEQAFKEEQKYIDDMAEKAMISNDMCCYLLGVKDLTPLSKGKQLDGTARYSNLDPFDGTPDYIALLDKQSVEFSSSMCKLRAFVKLHLPIIENMTKQKQIAEAS